MPAPSAEHIPKSQSPEGKQVLSINDTVQTTRAQ